MGLSQKALAEKCNMAHSYIRQLESGNRCPSFAFIGKIASALQIEPYQLLYDESTQYTKSTKSKYTEFVQRKLLESISESLTKNIQNAFDELKKYQ